MSMPQDLGDLMKSQQAYFLSGQTRSHAFRTLQLQRLRDAITAREGKILEALRLDLGKPELEAVAGEIGFMTTEINHALARLRSWMRPRRIATPIQLWPSSSYLLHEPLGQVLIIGPWNYPLQLLLAPLIAAIAAGNVAVLKPSELAPHTGAVVEEMIAETFRPEYIGLVQGGAEVTQNLLRREWDHIFFTGSTAVGRIVARAAAEHLTPVTLELGGKSPCIVDAETDVDRSAQRIVWGKFFNAGQTCVAPDYVLVHESVKQELVERMRHHLAHAFGTDPATSPDYARIINERHFDRLERLLGAGEVLVGGERDRATRYIAPTLIEQVPLTAPVMQEEIFGPILPLLTYRTLEEAIGIVRSLPKPLALYLFTTSRRTRRRILGEVAFGGGCVNDTLMHLSNPELPFGGIGASGHGVYHGRHGFETFSHRKSIMRSPFRIKLKVLYPPYNQRAKLVRRLMR